MNHPASLRSASRSRVLLALACAFGLTLASVPAVAATDTITAQPLADKALPLTPTFDKSGTNADAPFVLTLKNDSKDALKVSGKVLLSVVHHAMDKARAVPGQTVAAGGTMVIKDLSADDKVILTAAGYAALEVKVPFKL